MLLQLRISAMAAVGLPDDVLDTILTYLCDGHAAMRLGLCSRSWRRIVLQSSKWKHLWLSSGYSFAGFRARHVQGLSSLQKYSVAACAGLQMRSLRAASMSLVQEEDVPKQANLSLGVAVNQGLPQYAVYTVIQKVAYSSYDADHALFSKSVDLSSYPILKHGTLSHAETYARLLGHGNMCQPWNMTWYSISQNLEGDETINTVKGLPDKSRPYHLANAHADYPFLFFYQQKPQCAFSVTSSHTRPILNHILHREQLQLPIRMCRMC